ncbi:MAG: multidrug effflux MFS transporter [Saprospiraceae bacterium]|nr:multidrug effflux MFS transporter [Saprospiraceae bacterium]
MSQPKSTTYIIIILGALTMIGPFSIDMYLPGFPAIAVDLKTTIAEVQLSLASFFIGLSLGQLFSGPITDRFGRKKPLYVGLGLYMLASLACVFAPNVETLIALRFVQALGGSVGMVVARAVVRDLYQPEEMAKIFSLLMLVMGVAPIIAPSLGGLLASSVGWQAIFLTLTFISASILLGMYLALPETKKPDPTISLKPIPVLKDYFEIIKNRQFITYVMVGGISGAGMFAYISGSPFVFIQLNHIPEATFGIIFSANAFGLIMSGQLNRLALRRFSTVQIIKFVNALQLVFGILLVFYAWTSWGGLPMLIALIFLYMAMLGFLYPNAGALAMAPFVRNAGAASALMGSLHFVVSAISAGLVSAFDNGTALPMTGAMAICSLLVFILLRIKKAPEKKSETISEVAHEKEVLVS